MKNYSPSKSCAVEAEFCTIVNDKIYIKKAMDFVQPKNCEFIINNDF